MEIIVNNLTKKFKDVVAVNNISFKINTNQIFALLGVNGAGKTTTIKMLTGLIKKDAGEIFYNNLNLSTDIQKIKSFINISPQETAIAENLTVSENIKFIAEIYGIKHDSLNNKVNEIISKFNLTQERNKLAKFLSGGMKRRLSIAMAIVSEPKVLFLDEPTLGLDVLSRAELWTLIKKLKDEMTIILTSHYMEEVEKLADEVAIMNKGKIIAINAPNKLINEVKCKNLEEAFIKIVNGGE